VQDSGFQHQAGEQQADGPYLRREDQIQHAPRQHRGRLSGGRRSQ
jgi:hypothetical protein